jgi:cell fate regulator YaaT (PSP1 superfamily)
MTDDMYLVSHGKSAALGHFTSQLSSILGRGDRVVIDSPRGREVGTVLSSANVRQFRLLGGVAGVIVRSLTRADEAALADMRAMEERLFEAGRELARTQGLPVEILDVDMLFEDRAILQVVGVDQTPLDEFVAALRQAFRVDVRLEDLASYREPAAPAEHGCGKPDCGRTADGGCSTCATGGGCSSCGGGADLRPYFAHLRAEMEARNRTPLL